MSRLWYFSKDRSERLGPVETDALRGMLRNGSLLPTDLVWSDGMSDWAPAGNQADLQGIMPGQPVATQPMQASESAEQVGLPPHLTGWLHFVGIMSILSGLLYCATCVGALWGVLLIVGGVALLGARSTLANIRHVPPAFVPFMEKINTFFLVTGITYIIMLVGFLLGMIFYGGILIAALSQFPL